MNNSEFEEIVSQLKELQIRESVLLQRLERVIEENSLVARTNAIRGFAIGDLVEIKNPRPLQAKRGTVTKIGANRITVTTTRNGYTIIRSPANLRHID
jgi:hypothetical protein